MQDKEFKYYSKNRQKFLKLYEGKYIVISGETVFGVYDTHAQAYTDAVKAMPVGSFIIKHPVHNPFNV